MSATEILSYVLLFPNQEWSDSATNAQLAAVVSQVSPNISFAQDLGDNLQTLSTQNADRSGTTTGFLYVPDIVPEDACYNISKTYLPNNVTRQANLPPTDFTLVALAPWINVDCTLAFMVAARQDPNRAFLFYLPDNGTDAPPSPSSSVWDLQDGGAWKTLNQYPVYVIPGYYGSCLMRQLSLYSGNLTDAPYGHEISELPGIDPRDYVRMYTEIDNNNSATLPQFWVLLLLVIAVLVVLLGFTSASMHLIQRKRRHSLRRRVESGEVNLEALGIKRLTVPQESIDRLPLFIYYDESEQSLRSSAAHKRSPTVTTIKIPNSGSKNTSQTSQLGRKADEETPLPETTAVHGSSSIRDSALPHTFLPYSQPTCSICLEDFESQVTEIRELSCGHIYHPECIDTFLGSSSSLCPLCKKSALPPGSCPTTISDAMVRRERNLRRLRARVRLEDQAARAERATIRGRAKNVGVRLKNIRILEPRQNRDLASSPVTPRIGQQPLPRLPTQPQASVLGHEVPENPSRRAVVASRIRELASQQVFIQDPDTMNERRQLPYWKKTLSKVFPGFA